MNKPRLVIYHGNCLDGFGAAYAVWHRFGDEDTDYYPANHGDVFPEVAGREVYIVDFSYKREQLIQLCEQAKTVTIIDHHISALKELRGLDDVIQNLTLVFDMQHCGAVLSWSHFHTDSVPELLLDVEDRDLWKHQRDDSGAVNAALDSYPFDFSLWQQWATDPQGRKELVREGKAIMRFKRQLIDRYKKRAVEGLIAGVKIPVVNCPAVIVSEVVGELSIGYPFAAGYQDGGGVRSWSLRSNGDDGDDVSIIAARFGGGGHRNAAGFSTPLDDGNYRVEVPNG